MKKRMLFLILLLLAILMLLTACTPGDGNATAQNPAGFFWGIWHGWIAPVSLIIGFFNPEIRIYEPMNTGHWYDVGFYIALLGGFGGFALTRRKRGDKQERRPHDNK